MGSSFTPLEASWDALGSSWVGVMKTVDSYAHAEVVVNSLVFFIEIDVSNFEVFMGFDLEHLGLENCGRSVGFIST